MTTAVISGLSAHMAAKSAVVVFGAGVLGPRETKKPYYDLVVLASLLDAKEPTPSLNPLQHRLEAPGDIPVPVDRYEVHAVEGP